ncbi:MAG: tyrosine-type recombinase/integrase [Alphaproteobacteria bacterium]|nr:tyrosine-type recombinase/integrase [Alphaproteobacteria bacterium]
MLRRIAAAEILSGVDPQELHSLADLVAPERLKHALQFFFDRNGGKQSVQAFEAALLCLGIARHWARLPEDQVGRIANWVKKLRRPNTGMTEKNRERLRQFTSRAVILRILRLPDDLVAKAGKIPAGVSSALMAQKAVAIALLTTAPIRVGNLGKLDRQQHFRRAFSITDRRHHLVIPAAEVKNEVDLEFPVPKRVMTLIDHYMRVYQPLIGNGRASSLLFPGRSSDRPKELSGLRNSIPAVILKETGLHMNAHLFRHFAAYLYLKANPGQYEVVRQLLGHRRIETTINFYASFETDAAMQQFNQVIEGYREEAP